MEILSTTTPLLTTPISRISTALVERIDRVDERSGQLVIDADRDGQQPAEPARLQRVNHPQRQHVVAIAADVGVEDQSDRLGGLCRR